MRPLFRIPSILLLMVVAMFAVSSCGGKSVSRRETSEVIDLSGRWNDTDSQLVSEEMIRDSLAWPWIEDWTKAKGKKPVVMAYGVKNRTSEHINTQTFMKDLERAFLRSGKVSVVADSEQRDSVRNERAEQQGGLTANPSAIGKELGANYVITGVINAIEDRDGKERVVFYQTNLELINVETNEKVWIGDKKIKKLVDQSKVKL
ncbi:MAG: penicillin-binding protein activator LpoB [Deltaproteobacteria bacterium]|nr:penicillin-binding protein activator LpoB [Deltaproteobacteria bacterium]